MLEANHLPADTIEQVVEQELADPRRVAGARILSPYAVLKGSQVELSTVQAQLRRDRMVKTQIGISAALAAAGVICLFTPLPGSQGFAVILIKQGIAVAATVTAVAAGGAYTAAGVSEMRSLKDLRGALKTGLNQMMSGTYAQQEIGLIESVDVSSKDGISGFHTSKGFDFGVSTVDGERVFLSYTSWSRDLDLSRWKKEGALKFDGKVISAFDFMLYPLEKYRLLSDLEKKVQPNFSERLTLSNLVCNQIWAVEHYRKNEVVSGASRRGLIDDCREVGEMSRVYENGQVAPRALERSGELVRELLAVRGRI